MSVHIFDCDGVITDSNEIKTKAFRYVGEKFLDNNSFKDLMEFHLFNGGKSRWEKFSYVLKKNRLNHLDLDKLCTEYASFLDKELFKCHLVPGIRSFLENLIKKENIENVYVASAGEKNQVRKLIKNHNLPILKDHIYGSPTKKMDIIKFIKNKKVNEIFFVYGDSLHDAECAYEIKSNFIFIKGFTGNSEVQIANKYPIKNTFNDFRNLCFSHNDILFIP